MKKGFTFLNGKWKIENKKYTEHNKSNCHAELVSASINHQTLKQVQSDTIDRLRIYKVFGFTLAEILIVLTIIGVMAVMTIPSLIQNSNSQQKITLFKKGFNAITNAYATEFAVKSPPQSVNDKEKMWNALNNQLNVKYYIDRTTGTKVFDLNDIKAVENVYYRVIVAEDGIGYVLSGNDSGDCKSKLEINSGKKSSDIFGNNNCMHIAVLIDDLNTEKSCHVNSYGGDTQSLDNIKCNALWFSVTKDGITSGNPDCTIGGRIISDNTTYDPSKCTEPTP